MTYLGTVESRGVGAIAADDLGPEALGLIRASVTGRLRFGARRAPPRTRRSTSRRGASPFNLLARLRASRRFAALRRPIATRTGRALSPPARRMTTVVSAKPAVRPPAASVSATAESIVPAAAAVIARPAPGTVSAGVMPGSPPALSKPLMTAQVAPPPASSEPAPAMAPVATASKASAAPSRKGLVIAGVGIAALGLFIVLRRKS